MEPVDPRWISEESAWQRFLRSVTRVALTVGIVTCLGVAGFAAYVVYDLNLAGAQDRRLDLILNWQPKTNSEIFDRNRELLAQSYIRDSEFVPYEKLPRGIVQTILAIEDRNFFSHPGIDLKAIIRAAWRIVRSRGKTVHGASTITQQVVRNFLLTKEKTWIRKVTEIILAVKLERLMSKERIFEIYVNSMFLGAGAYGAPAAAQRYFNRPLSELSLHEHALIAGLFQAPSRYNPRNSPKLAKARQGRVLKAMVNAGFIGYDLALSYYKMDLNYDFQTKDPFARAPFFTAFVAQQAASILGLPSIKSKGLRVYTTLDPIFQREAEQVVEAAAEDLQRLADDDEFDEPIEAALMATNPSTGEILAMVGGTDFERSQFNRATALRQPGSLFKPIVYLTALEEGYKWSDMSFVPPVSVGGYRPRSMYKDYLKETTLLRAFYRSINGPVIELGQKIGLSRILETASKLGIESPLKEELGSLLGSSELSMHDLARVFGTIANQGTRPEIGAIVSIEDSDGQILYERPANDQPRVIPEREAFLMVKAMQQVIARGTASSAREMASVFAGKTGTSNDGRDCWFVGINPDLVTSVWVGYDNNNPMPASAMGGTVALPIWQSYMQALMRSGISFDRFSQPSGVVDMHVNSHFGHISSDGVEMWFLRENRPTKKKSTWQRLSRKERFRDVFN